MPQLKQLSCTVQWADTGAPFQEYGTVYGDGLVESFIVVPNIPQPFTIHLKSLRYIFEGLAMVVFIDGRYQANRNRVNLKSPKSKVVSNQTQVDFLLRQQEKPLGEGVYLGREWRFDDHNISTIEVLVLRCRARVPEEADASGSSSAADSDVMDAKGERGAINKEDESNNKPSDKDGPVGGESAIFEEGSVATFADLSFGYDGTNDPQHLSGMNGGSEQPSYPAFSQWHGQHHPEHQPSAPPPMPHHSDQTFGQQQRYGLSYHAPVSQKQVRFDLGPQPYPLHATPLPGHTRPPSYERTRYPSGPSYQDHQSDTFHQTSTSLPTRSHGPPPLGFNESNNYYIPPHQQHGIIAQSANALPRLVSAPTLGPPLTQAFHYPHYVYNQSSVKAPDAPPYHPPSWPIQPPHLVYNPYQHHHGPSWPIPPNVYAANPGPAIVPDPSKDSSNSNNYRQWSTMGQNQSSNNTTEPPWDSWNANTNDNNPRIGANSHGTPNWQDSNQNNDNLCNWKSNQSRSNISSTWPNDGNISAQNSSQIANGNTGNFAETPDNNEHNNNDWSNTDSNNTWANNENDNDDNRNNDWVKDNSVQNNNDWDGPSSDKLHGGLDDKSTTNAGRALFGPHGQYYAYKPKGSDEPAADAEEEPRYDIPKKIADATGSTKQVLPGSGYMYWKRRCAPQYVDTLEEPYARFVFKYRTKDQVEKEIGLKIDVEPTGDEAVQELQNLDKQALIEMLLRAKSALGGKVPSPRLKPTTLSINSTGPVAVDPPDNTYLKYALPTLRHAITNETSNNAGGHDNTNKSGWATGLGAQPGNWDTNNNDNSGWTANSNAGWNANDNSNNGNINWNKTWDGAGEPNGGVHSDHANMRWGQTNVQQSLQPNLPTQTNSNTFQREVKSTLAADVANPNQDRNTSADFGSVSSSPSTMSTNEPFIPGAHPLAHANQYNASINGSWGPGPGPGPGPGGPPGPSTGPGPGPHRQAW